MPIIPDTKDWTVVLREGCRDCGFAPSWPQREGIAAAMLAMLPRWHVVVARPEIARRPDDATWSGLEYAAHVRDALGIFGIRLRLMLTEHEPTFDDWDQDAAAVTGRYAEASPVDVGAELESAIRTTAENLEALTDRQWDRGGYRGDGAAFTVESLARYFLHDVGHHLHDVGG